MKLRQYKLRRLALYPVPGFQENVCWLEDGRVKVGDSVTLKDDGDSESAWEVMEAYSTIEQSDLKDHRGTSPSIQGRGSLRDV